jgi:hypothetical protein
LHCYGLARLAAGRRKDRVQAADDLFAALRGRADWCDLWGLGVSGGETGTGSVIIGVSYAL